MEAQHEHLYSGSDFDRFPDLPCGHDRRRYSWRPGSEADPGEGSTSSFLDAATDFSVLIHLLAFNRPPADSAVVAVGVNVWRRAGGKGEGQKTQKQTHKDGFFDSYQHSLSPFLS